MNTPALTVVSLELSTLTSNGKYSLSTTFNRTSTNESRFFEQEVATNVTNNPFRALVYCPYYRTSNANGISIEVNAKGKNELKTDFVDNTISIARKDSYDFSRNYAISPQGRLIFQSQGFLDVTEIKIIASSLIDLEIVIFYTDSNYVERRGGNVISPF